MCGAAGKRDSGAFLTDKNDQTRMVKTPVFTFKMFKVHQNAKKIPITLQSESFKQNVNGTNFNYPYLTASASLDSNGIVNITVSNSDLTNSRNLQINLNGSKTFSSVKGEIITANEVTAYNDFGKQELVNIQPLSNDKFSLSGKTLTVQVPSKSVILLSLTPVSTGVIPSVSRHSVERGFSIKSTAAGSITIDYTTVSILL